MMYISTRKSFCCCGKQIHKKIRTFPLQNIRDMIPTFGLSVPELCMLLTLLSTTLTRNIAIWNDALLSPANLQRYAESIAAKGAPLGNCFGFVDGTPMCRPKENQRAVCNGHKRVHSLKFQLVALPNGMVASLYDPIEEHAFSPTGQPMCIMVIQPIRSESTCKLH